ncbi:MAG TPA: 2-C-methyl-D-erythritol 4-phosphate cytidylyltransferase [Acidimicrobiales bacterium]|jgi:2-C-methyl-D-erythritol 4-phosphate cytidylyltransferase|nr:2-C-methyl-D-erythritol 4-phosphate cytidylyltransferase [Acidimicrobiales bacterium]
MSVWAVVVAAGAGVRFGTLKQYEQLGDRRVLDWALERTRAVADGIVLVVPPERAGESEPGVDAVVSGAETRAGSVRAGLAAVPHEAEVVVVHDAARPLASAGLFERVVAAVRAGADGAVPGVPVADTVKVVDDGVVTETLDRTRLVAVQTPQAFAAGALRRAHEGDGEGTDDAALVEAAGGRVVVVPGEDANAKITTQHDLLVARTLAELT